MTNVEQNSAGSISVSGLRREYAEHTALDSVDLQVTPGEFLTLLGPSGSGKSTLLHLIAGLGEATSGEIFIDGENVTNMPAQKRGIGLVFQSYALFPHLTARGNIEFPLTVKRGGSAKDRHARVEEILDLVHLAPQADRHPSELSGGQQQRVAVGRALSGSPRVLLLDEPLGALDRKLRHQLGRELRRIQQETKVTTIYVTHDQEEAFLMSDRIAVMNNGRIQQIGTPDEVYFAPANAFVASFIGDINYLPIARSSEGELRLVLHKSRGTLGGAVGRAPAQGDGDASVLGVRPEDLRFARTAEELQRDGSLVFGAATLIERVFQGSTTRLAFQLEDGRELRALDVARSPFNVGTTLFLGAPEERTMVLQAPDPS